MKSNYYKKKIKKALENLGVYKAEFNLVIDKLSDIMEEYDEAAEMVKEKGRYCQHTNKGGATNDSLNPAALTMRQCRTDALAYLRDLGLTPAGLRKLDKEEKNTGGIMDALAKLGS